MANRFTKKQTDLIMNGGDSDWELYIHSVPKRRMPKLEPYIAKHPRAAYAYAYRVIQGRWSEAEPTIMQKPYLICHYARDIIRGRWPEAEPVILGSMDLYSIGLYIEGVIRGPWPEAEPLIYKDHAARLWYDKFLKEIGQGRK